MEVQKEECGKIDNRTIYSFTLVNAKGMTICCTNYGCIITKILTADRLGNFENIVLGYNTFEEYLVDSYYLGAIVGRVAGRIRNGTFDLDGEEYQLSKNNKVHHLHGGHKGFNKVIWEAESFKKEHEIGVNFTYFSRNGEEGYPGNVKITVTYSLNNQNELSIRYAGKTDQKTLLSMTNHTYFNLSGDCKRDILGHALKIKSEQFLELNDEFLPTGKLLNVTGTPFDFSQWRFIRTGTTSEHPQNRLVGEGYDHPFMLNNDKDDQVVLKDEESGRKLTIETDEAGVVVYSGNQLMSDGIFRKYLGICLETQCLPDAIHHPQFPSCILEHDQEYRRQTIYKFGIL
jgi:aldose 1-epimerase